MSPGERANELVRVIQGIPDNSTASLVATIIEEIRAAAEEARQQEREACAKIAAKMQSDYAAFWCRAEDIAFAIRTRSAG